MFTIYLDETHQQGIILRWNGITLIASYLATPPCVFNQNIKLKKFIEIIPVYTHNFGISVCHIWPLKRWLITSEKKKKKWGILIGEVLCTRQPGPALVTCTWRSWWNSVFTCPPGGTRGSDHKRGPRLSSHFHIPQLLCWAHQLHDRTFPASDQVSACWRWRQFSRSFCFWQVHNKHNECYKHHIFPGWNRI